MSHDLSAIRKKSPLDRIVNLIKAGCSSIPFAGGIATLIDDYIPKSTEASLNKFILDLKGKNSKLKLYCYSTGYK